MPAWSSILLFVMTASVVVMTPGQRCISSPAVWHTGNGRGDRGHGHSHGNLLHAGATTLGISALLVSSALALGAVQYCGAALLLYHGLHSRDGLVCRPEAAPAGSVRDRAGVLAVASPCPQLLSGILINLPIP
jgi:threonine/homoserine/homoserine lactone efflux protein